MVFEGINKLAPGYVFDMFTERMVSSDFHNAVHKLVLQGQELQLTETQLFFGTVSLRKVEQLAP